MIYLHVYDLVNQAKAQSKQLLIKNLSYYLEKKVKKQEIKYNENGKPEIKGVSFSISHSKNTLVQVFTRKGVIGVDVEKHNMHRNYLALSKRYFSEQEYLLLSQLSRTDALTLFYHLWTAKEAVCKAQGGRLWYYLKDNYLSKENKIVEIFKGLNLMQFKVISGFSLSLASQAPQNNIKIIHE